MSRLRAFPAFYYCIFSLVCFASSCCIPGVICIPPPESPGRIFSPKHNTPFVNNSPDSSATQPVADNSKSGLPNIYSTLVAGPNISFKSSEEENTYGGSGKHSPGIGFQLGVGTTWQASEKFNIFSALLFKQQNASEKYSGYQYEPGGNGSTKEEQDKYSFNYISLPVLACYNITPELSIGAGPELNYLVSGSIKPSGEDKQKITSQLVRFGVGAQAVARYKLPSKSSKSGFALQLVYDHRISRLNKKMLEGYETPAWRMKGVQLSLLYNFCK